MPHTPPPPTTLLLRNLPPNSFVGIDLASFTATPQFLGIRLIPPGLHLFYHSPTGESSLRAGFWFCAAGSVIAKRWDGEVEAMVDDDDGGGGGDLEGCIGERLMPYRQRDWLGRVVEDGGVWRGLSGGVSKEVLQRCLGDGWKCGTADVSRVDLDVVEEELMGFGFGGGGGEARLGWTGVDLKRTWPVGVVGRERTEMAMDRSWALDHLLGGCGEGELLGEFELAFLVAVTLGCYSAMEQYRRLLGLILTCRRVVLGDRVGFFGDLVEVLLRQLEYVDGEFFAGFLGGGEGDDYWLAKLLGRFAMGLKEDGEELVAGKGERGKERVLETFGEIESLVKRKFDWVLDPRDMVRKGLIQTEDGDMVEVQLAGLDEEDETGEYAPVIVGEFVDESDHDSNAEEI